MYFLKTVCCPLIIRQTDQRKRVENQETFPSTYENVVYTKVTFFFFNRWGKGVLFNK